MDGAINYWHFNAKMQARGMRKLIDIDDAARALDLIRKHRCWDMS